MGTETNEEKTETKRTPRDLMAWHVQGGEFALVFVEVAKDAVTGCHTYSDKTGASLCGTYVKSEVDEDYDSTNSVREVRVRSKVTAVDRVARMYNSASSPHTSPALCMKCRTLMEEADNKFVEDNPDMPEDELRRNMPYNIILITPDLTLSAMRKAEEG